jgi:hypothetical protein
MALVGHKRVLRAKVKKISFCADLCSLLRRSNLLTVTIVFGCKNLGRGGALIIFVVAADWTFLFLPRRREDTKRSMHLLQNFAPSRLSGYTKCPVVW